MRYLLIVLQSFLWNHLANPGQDYDTPHSLTDKETEAHSS